MADPYLFSAIFVLIYIIIWFTIAQIIRDNGIMDVAWGLGFILLSWANWWTFGYPYGLLIPLIVTIYGLRLSIHIFFRNRGRGEDWRYANWRKEWGKTARIQAFFKVFLLQGFFLWVIALPLMQVEKNIGEMHQNFLLYVGFALWLFGILWESIADWQLLSFKKQKKNQGKIMRSGLWAFSRHPNYFGEMLLWWGIFLIGLSHSLAWFTIISPIVLTWLLTRVSGVPMLESKYRDNPEYQTYVREVNAFLPGIPAKRSN